MTAQTAQRLATLAAQLGEAAMTAALWAQEIQSEIYTGVAAASGGLAAGPPGHASVGVTPRPLAGQGEGAVQAPRDGVAGEPVGPVRRRRPAPRRPAGRAGPAAAAVPGRLVDRQGDAEAPSRPRRSTTTIGCCARRRTRRRPSGSGSDQGPDLGLVALAIGSAFK